MKIAAKIGLRKKPAVLLCPVCGHRLTPNKGWAAQFYDGYCNRCDMAVDRSINNRPGSKKQNKNQ